MNKNMFMILDSDKRCTVTRIIAQAWKNCSQVADEKDSAQCGCAGATLIDPDFQNLQQEVLQSQSRTERLGWESSNSNNWKIKVGNELVHAQGSAISCELKSHTETQALGNMPVGPAFRVTNNSYRNKTRHIFQQRNWLPPRPGRMKLWANHGGMRTR